MNGIEQLLVGAAIGFSICWGIWWFVGILFWRMVEKATGIKKEDLSLTNVRR